MGYITSLSDSGRPRIFTNLYTNLLMMTTVVMVQMAYFWQKKHVVCIFVSHSIVNITAM